jgi:hypothetical protein
VNGLADRWASLNFGPRLMPAWFLAFLTLIALGLSVAGYVALLVGIRSPIGFERAGGPLGVAS